MFFKQAEHQNSLHSNSIWLNVQSVRRERPHGHRVASHLKLPSKYDTVFCRIDAPDAEAVNKPLYRISLNKHSQRVDKQPGEIMGPGE